ncbi:MAG: GNAT family N-acetyltransferase [Sulfurimonas sp.]
MQEVYKITPQTLKDRSYFEDFIVPKKTNNYYWSDEWSEEFYIDLAKLGFISTTYETPNEGLILLPELQFAYAVLFFENLHISKKVIKLLKRDDYELSFNSGFDEVLDGFGKYHKDNWLKGEYKALLKRLYEKKYDNFKLMSVELKDKASGKLIAAEVGYIIGRTYTSLSGFCSKEKRYRSYGTLQLVLLAQHLQHEGFAFWNLGHPFMDYKKHLGAKILEREEFLTRWREATICTFNPMTIK